MKKKKIELGKKLILSKQEVLALNGMMEVTGGGDTLVPYTNVNSGCPQCVVEPTGTCTDTLHGGSFCVNVCTVTCQTRKGQLGCL